MKTDIIIAGGGTVGCCLALALAKLTDLNIAIIEAKAYQADQAHPGFDARSLAIAKHSQRVMDSWGLDIGAIGTAIKQIKVTDQGHIGQCWLDCAEQNLDALGYVVELHQLGQQLHQALDNVASSRLHWYCPDQIAAIEQHQECIKINLASQQTLEARLLVVADGAKSPSAQMMGVKFQQQDYHQVALIANVATSKPHHNQAFERFTGSGPLALLPLAGNQCSLVWTLTTDEYQSIRNCADSVFLSALQAKFGYALGEFTQVSQRYGFPLSLLTADASIQHRTVIMGNAAHSLHPIAGQGFNLGLRDVEALAQLLANSVRPQQDIGDYRVLHQYQQMRQADQSRVIGLTDGLVRLFSNQYLPLVVGRNLGLSIVNSLSGLKNSLAKQAMGLNAASTASSGIE
ncbi:2-octaprenyl-6-methoxyphenyl hydroxylase [Neptunicella sp. SCSIO 80796]|uniref:2-octaprenyl-6-methoxyphenyl hydroxylase n=1 Tax=Neptunicella plasticusilytica TaxID=3117012 RepID=UPI003A4E1FE6